jgi:hypothetical protein
MGHLIQRLGFGISPGWAIGFLLVGLVVLAAFWVGPLRTLPPELQLVALRDDGTFTDSVAASAPDSAGATVRFPLVLAAHNVGYQPARPTVLSLSIPLSYRLVDRHGQAYPRETVPGTPLGRYRLGLSAPTLAPGGFPEMLLDTLWLEPDIASYTCTVLSDGVPEFAPAPAINPALLGRVDIFYSFRSPETSSRQAGLLRVRVPPEALLQPPAPMGVGSAPIVIEPAAPMPDMGGLIQTSTVNTMCGDPQQPVLLQSVAYTNEGGARFVVLYHDGAPRKYLFDLNGDSMVDREMWDPDGDGDFEAERSTRYALPAFLFPRELESMYIAGDSVPPDSAFLALFHDTRRGPFRFAAAMRPQPVPDSAAAPPDSMAARVDIAGEAPAPAAPMVAGAVIPGDTMPVDSAWLQLYRDTAAGPFRFARRAQQRADSIAALPAQGVDTATARDTTPARPRQTGPRLLGTPVEYPPGSRPPPD